MNVINQIALFWWQWMGNMLWQVSLLIMLISGIDLLIRKWAWPQVRYGLWLLVLVKLILSPNWSFPTGFISQVQPQVRSGIISRWQISDPHPDSNTQELKNQISPKINQNNLSATTQQSQGPESTTIQITDSNQLPTKPIWQTVAMTIWLSGILILITILIGKMKRLRRWHQQQEEKSIPDWFHKLLVQTATQLKISQLPAIVFNDQAVTPAVYGVFRPVMLLPANYFKHLSREEAEHVLIHELAHLKRGDLWIHSICLGLQVIYWFNPLLIWVRRQMKHVREICCDLTVASTLREKTKDYRQTLLNTARKLLTETVEPGLGLLGVFEEPFRLVTRLQWLEKKTWENRRRMIGTALTINLILAVVILPMAALEKTDEVGSGPVQKDDTGVVISQPQKIDASNFNTAQIKLKQIEPICAVVLPRIGDPNEFEEAISELKKQLKRNRIKPTGPPFGRFFSDPDKIDRAHYSWEVGFPVKEGTRVKQPLEIIRIAQQQVASISIEGVKDTEKVWDLFINGLDQRGFIPGFPPAVEIYRSDSKDQPFWTHTELQIQAFRPNEGYPGLDIHHKKTQPGTAIILPGQGSYAQFEDAMNRLKKYIKKTRIKTTGNPFAQFFTNPAEVPPSEFYWEVGYPIQKKVDVEEPFEIREFGSGQVASAIFEGPANYEYPWSPFLIQSILKGYIPIGQAIEVYINKGKKNSKVELQIPIMRMSAHGEDITEWTESLGETMTEWGDSIAEEFEKEELFEGKKSHYVKEISYLDKNSDNKMSDSKIVGTNEIWIGDRIISMTERNRTLILDRKKNALAFINHENQTYLETDLPINKSQILSPDLQWMYNYKRPMGTVEETKTKKDISGKSCRLYKLTYWDLQGETKMNKRNIEVWSTTDVPFEYDLFHEIMQNRRIIYNYDEGLREELKKIKGIQMFTEIHGSRPGPPFVSEVVEIAEKGLMTNVFGIPEGYTKKQKLTPHDMGIQIPKISKDDEHIEHPIKPTGKNQNREDKDLRSIIESISDKANRAFVEGDDETLLSFYTEDVIVKQSLKPEIRGKEALKKDIEETHKTGIRFQSFNTNILNIWSCGDLVYEIGTYGLSLTAPQVQNPIADQGKYFSIWERQPDGSYKAKYSIWNTDIHPNKR